jgi:predicted S18 family serine protease
MKVKTYAVISVVLIAFLVAVFSVHGSSGQYISKVGTTSVYIFGVSIEPNGTVVGVPALLTLTITNGTGQVFLGSTPLTAADTQAQAEVSAQVACQLINVNCNKYNFYYYITSSSANISGPSAGAAFSIVAMSILTGKSLNSQVAMTGTANPDGSIGLVGDVAAKSEAAASQGIKVFLYPAYEPSPDNITQSAISYDAKLGMVTIPINSVYQAYQYFTGYNITPVLNYHIYTGLYNSLMNATYQEFNAYQEAIYNSLPSQTTSNSTINSLIQSALASIQQERQLAAAGNYYVAASEIVNTSATLLLYAKTLEELSASSSPTRLINNMISFENSSIQQTYSQVTKNYLTNSSTLDLKFIAIDRLSEAQSYLSQAEGELDYSLSDAAYYYSLSEVKRASSLFWVVILPGGNSNFSESSYYNLSNYYLYKSALFMNYADLLGNSASPNLDQMQYYFNLSQFYQNQGHYVASIFNSLETISIAELVIEENSIDVNGSVAQVTNQISVSALRAINAAEESGVTPFLGVSYYQFGNNFGNSSLANYIEFESLSREYTNFETSLTNISAIPFSPVFQPATIPPLPVDIFQILAYALLGVALGILVSGIIYEYKLSRILKRVAISKPQRRMRSTSYRNKKRS